MSRTFFATELEGVATFWRILRKDGVTLGFTSHDRALYFEGLHHRAAPGMVPSAIRKSSSLTSDSAEVQGVLSASSIRSKDLRAGRYDGAVIQIGAIDWESLDSVLLYHGTLGRITEEGNAFNAELVSAKSAFEDDLVPRTSPSCRAQFCGKGCNLSGLNFTTVHRVTLFDAEQNLAAFGQLDGALYVGGELRWLDGPDTGQRNEIMDHTADGLVLASPVDPDTTIGTRALLKEGCDHTLATCHSRFANAVNFRGEPFLPGNDLIARYPLPA